MRLHSALFLAVPLCLGLAQQPSTRYQNEGVFSRHWSGILVDADCTPPGSPQVAGIVSPDMTPDVQKTPKPANAERPRTESQGEADRAMQADRSSEAERNPDLAPTTHDHSTAESKTVRTSTQ